MDLGPPLPAPPQIEHCYRHPSEETRVHCTRCGRPICPRCMIPAPVGYQCPECVGQARREFRRGPGRRATVAGLSVTKVLLAVMAGAFVLEVIAGGPGSLLLGPSTGTVVRLGGSVALYPAPSGYVGIVAGQYWRLLTSMFLHAGIIHIGFNAYALWIFGPIIEEELGRVRMLLIFFTTGLVAGAASYAFAPPEVALGASGAIFGLFGAFVAYNYRRRDTALGSARLRAAVSMIVLNALLALSIHVIDWRAHLGGFVAGLIAGWVAEGAGSASTRRAILVVGMVALLAVAIGLTAWRTAELRAQLPPGIVSSLIPQPAAAL